MTSTFIASRNIIKTIFTKQINNTIKTSIYIPITNQIQQQQQQQRLFHNSCNNRGFDEFIEKKVGGKTTTGRAWTVPDLRRKGFDDLHKLWYISLSIIYLFLYLFSVYFLSHFSIYFLSIFSLISLSINRFVLYKERNLLLSERDKGRKITSF
jgi:hypothetical protein